MLFFVVVHAHQIFVFLPGPLPGSCVIPKNATNDEDNIEMEHLASSNSHKEQESQGNKTVSMENQPMIALIRE